jgi:hypothetical protein
MIFVVSSRGLSQYSCISCVCDLSTLQSTISIVGKVETGLDVEREASLLGVEASIPLLWCPTPHMVTILQIQRAVGLNSKALLI